MDLRKLIFGTLLLIVGYIPIEKYFDYINRDTFNLSLIELSIIEAIAYSIVVLIAFRIKKILTFVLLPITMSVLNFILVLFGTPFVGTVVGYILEFIGFTYPDDISTRSFLLIQLSVLGAFGAFIFCLVLYAYSVTKWLTLKMYFLIAFLCAVSAIAALFLDSSWFLIINKSIWWIMFSLGIFVSVQYSEKHIFNKKTV